MIYLNIKILAYFFEILLVTLLFKTLLVTMSILKWSEQLKWCFGDYEFVYVTEIIREARVLWVFWCQCIWKVSRFSSFSSYTFTVTWTHYMGIVVTNKSTLISLRAEVTSFSKLMSHKINLLIGDWTRER